jgi:hypothetical protein
METSDQLHVPAHLLREKNPDTHSSLVAISTELSRLLLIREMHLNNCLHVPLIEILKESIRLRFRCCSRTDGRTDTHKHTDMML